MSCHKPTHTQSRHRSPERPTYVYELLRKQNQNRNHEYQLVKLLGEGGFAKCFKTKRTHDQKVFAIKAINLNQKNDSTSQDKQKPSKRPRVSTQQKAVAEANFLKICNHRNIVRYETHFTYDNVFYIVMEHCTNGSFGDMLKQRKTISQVEARYYISQMVHGLLYLKQRRIIHRDLKPANYLLNDKMELKIADFGLATEVRNGAPVFSNICGTPNYLSPEMLGKKNYSYEVDVWSLGVALYAMLYGMPPFETKKKDANETYEKIKKCDYSFSSSKVSLSDDAIDLISKILILDPSKRIPLQQILDHPFMSSFNIPRELPCKYLKKEPDSKFLMQYDCRIKGTDGNYRVRSGSSSEKPTCKSNDLKQCKKPMRYCPPEFQKEERRQRSFTKCQADNYESIRENIKREIKRIKSETKNNERQSESRRPKSIGEIMKKLQKQEMLTSSPISSNASIVNSNQNKYVQYPSQSQNEKNLIPEQSRPFYTISNVDLPLSEMVKDGMASQASIQCEAEPVVQIQFPNFAHLMKPLSFRKGPNYEDHLEAIKMDWREIGKANLRSNSVRKSFKIVDPISLSKKNEFQTFSDINYKDMSEKNICSLQEFLLCSTSTNLTCSKLFKMLYCLKQHSSNQSTFQKDSHTSTRFIGLIFNDNSSIITKLTQSGNQVKYSSVYIQNVLTSRTNQIDLYQKEANQNHVKNGNYNDASRNWFTVQLDIFGKEKGSQKAYAISDNKIELEINYQLMMKMKFASSTIKLFKHTFSKYFVQAFPQNKTSKSQFLTNTFVHQTTSTIKDFKFIKTYRSRHPSLYFQLNDGSNHYLEKDHTKLSYFDLFKKTPFINIKSYRYVIYFSKARAGFLKDVGGETFKPLRLEEISSTVVEKRAEPCSRNNLNIKVLQEETGQSGLGQIKKKVKLDEESSKFLSNRKSNKLPQKQNFSPNPKQSQKEITSYMLQKICKQFQSKLEMHYIRERDATIKKRQESVSKPINQLSVNRDCELSNNFYRLEIKNGELDFKLDKKDAV